LLLGLRRPLVAWRIRVLGQLAGGTNRRLVDVADTIVTDPAGLNEL